MKNLFKKIIIGCLSVLTACTASLFVACGNTDGGADWADSDPTTASYKFTVKDEDGNAVKDHYIQYCLGDTCLQSEAKTDANGVLVLHVNPAEYEIHILTEDLKQLETTAAVTTTKEDSEYSIVVKNLIDYVITVVDGDGAVVSNVGVRLQEAANESNKTDGVRTGDDGKATISAVPNDYVVILNAASSRDYEIVSSDVAVSATKTEITVTVQAIEE
ncbi:MAG: carboxypeptidase regulatory-like domain-containing protein [Clostridiales bacterium]|nr:carboxypeptidase regulatory-like domain-containing protein [Clostridiales bacterium]